MARMRMGAWLAGAVAVAGLVVAAVLGVGPAGASGPGWPAGTWSMAWTPALPGGGIGSVGCAPGGYCVTVGGPDVLIARDGVWGQPQPLDLSALGSYASAGLDLVTCPSAGNCVAAGHYAPATPGAEPEPFAVAEHDGRWGRARPLGVLEADPSTGPVTAPVALACSSAGDCAAAVQQDLTYYDGRPDGGFVIAERNGTWRRPDYHLPLVRAFSCASHYCVGTFYYPHRGVIIERAGSWTWHRISGLRPGSYPVQVSCSPDGTCTIAGYNLSGYGDFAVSEKNGTWGKPRMIPGTQGTRVGYNTTALSCPRPGACTLGGFIEGAGGAAPFTATQRKGTWSRPRPIPGMAAINPNKQATLGALSCPAPGQCAAGGYLTTPTFYDHAYLATETGGRWGKAFLVPGITTLEQKGGRSHLNAMSCWAVAHCIAAGYYDTIQPASGHPFITAER